MPGLIGTQNKDFYLGDKKLGAVYVGDTLKWRSGVSLSTGIATQVPGTRTFTQNIWEIAYHNNMLFAVSHRLGSSRAPTERAALYTINTTNGVVSTASSFNNFGVGEDQPTGLTSHNNNLYMSGTDHTLYRLVLTNNRLTSTTTIGSYTGDGGRITSIASDGTNLYGFGSYIKDGSSIQAYYTINPTTAALTKVNDVSGITDVGPRGHSVFGGNHYIADYRGVYSVNPTSAVVERIGSATSFGASLFSSFGLANDGKTMYMVGAKRSGNTITRALYSLA